MMTVSEIDRSAKEKSNPFQFNHSPGFPDILSQLGGSLWLSTYQAGKLIVLRPAGDRLSALLRTFDNVMGLAVSPTEIAIGTRYQVWVLRNAPDIARQLPPSGCYQAAYLPRMCFVTGDIRIHEIAWVGDELWCVNTRFSCLCTPATDYSFVPRWQPPFISELAGEDRCHLNGMAVEDGAVRYVTAHGTSNAREGWRESKADGGVVIDVPTGEIVARNLSMPHSPRFHDGRLFALDSGRGRLIVINPATGTIETVAELPGYCRGLALAGRYAFVGLSKVRETSFFGGLPISERSDNPRCGVWVVDIPSGNIVGNLIFQHDVDELFDVQFLPGIASPAVIGLEKEAIHTTFVVPSTK